MILIRYLQEHNCMLIVSSIEIKTMEVHERDEPRICASE